MELSLSSQFNTRIPIDLAPFVESHQNLTYTLSYPNHIFIVLSKCFSAKLKYFWNTMIINTIFFVWIFYIALLYQNFFHLNWTPVYIPYLIWDYSMLILKEIDCSINALPRASESLFFHTDTLFASVKPIHKTPLAIITLRI